MAVATFTKSSAHLGQNVVSHHCRALRISASRRRSYSSSISLASSIVGFLGTVPSLYLLCDSTCYARPFPSRFLTAPPVLPRASRSVRQRDTFILPADNRKQAKPCYSPEAF